MYEGNLVICDQEKQYARNLLQMFSRNRKAEIQMYLFHTIEELEKFAGQKKIQILLIDKEYPLKQREQIPAEKKFVLVKNIQDSLAENEKGVYRYQSAEAIWYQIQNGEMPKQIQKNRNIRNLKEGVKENKPQSVEEYKKQKKIKNLEEGEKRQKLKNFKETERNKKIQNLDEIERRKNLQGLEENKKIQTLKNIEGNEKAAERPNSEEKERKQNLENLKERQEKDMYKTSTDAERRIFSSVCPAEIKGSLIGIYSPIHRIGKTKFAMKLGRELAKKEPVLYLNLEEYAGGDFYFHDQTGQTLADLLYYARQEKGNLGLRISMMAGQDEELDYILPMPYVQDLQEVSVEEWLKLFDQILENCIYQKVILDLGDSINGLFQILEACHTVYTPYIEDGAARAKMNQYAENLRKIGKEKVLEKTIQKKMEGGK